MNEPRAKRGYFIINNKKHHVYDGINIIGRNKEAAVIIKENIVSHQHAILVITKRHHYLSDTKSFNGTFVGDKKLIPFHLHYLDNKATVKFATVKSTYFFIEDDEIILENTYSQTVDDSIYCCKTQVYDSYVSVNVQSELNKQREKAITFHDTDGSTMEIISPGYENGNVKSNNESVSNSISVIDETVINYITNRNEEGPEPELCYENRTNSVQPTSQYLTKNADTDSQSHTSKLSKKKLSFGHKEQNEEEGNKMMHKGTELSDEADFEDITTQKDDDTEFQAPVRRVSKRKRNIITSDDEDFEKKESQNSVKKKSKETSDDTKIEIETLQEKKIAMTVVEDKTHLSGDSSLDDTDRKSNASGISGRKKRTFVTNQSNKNSNLFKKDVIGEKQGKSRSETDVEIENKGAKNEEADERRNALDDKLNDMKVIPETPNLSEGETNFDFNAQAEPKSSKVPKTKKELHSDVFIMPTILNATAKENELNSSNNSDIVQATPNCFKGKTHSEPDNYSKNSHKSQDVLFNESINSEQSETEGFHSLSQNLVAIDELIVNEMESKIVANDVYLQPTKSQQKVPPCDANLFKKKQEVEQISEKYFDKLNNTIDNNEVKNNDETGNKVMDRSPVSGETTSGNSEDHLKQISLPQPPAQKLINTDENILIDVNNTDIADLQPTQLLPAFKKATEKREMTESSHANKLNIDDALESKYDEQKSVPTKKLEKQGEPDRCFEANKKNDITFKSNNKKKSIENKLADVFKPCQPDSGVHPKMIEANEALVDPSPVKVQEKIELNQVESQKIKNTKKSVRSQAKTTGKASGKRTFDEHVSTRLRRNRGNSATDNIINISIINNNNETMNESGITQFTELRTMNEYKNIAQRNVSPKQLHVVDDATKKPTNDVNSALTEDSIYIDKHLKTLPQNETTRITRAKRKATKNKKPHDEDRNKENSPKSKSLPSPATDHNHEESSDSDDDFFAKPHKSSKRRITNKVDGGIPAARNKVQGIDIIEKHESMQNPKVAFTMLHRPELESVITSLGGSIVDTVDACTVLLTGCVKRSQKLLSAVGLGKPICSTKWLLKSKKLGKFLDPWDYILEDDEAEQKWNFTLRESLNRSTNKKLLEGYSCQLVVNNAQDALKGAIEACGGKCVTRAPPKNSTVTLVVVASPENRAKYAKFLKRNPRPLIVATEAIFDGVLRQELNFEDHLLT